MNKQLIKIIVTSAMGISSLVGLSARIAPVFAMTNRTGDRAGSSHVEVHGQVEAGQDRSRRMGGEIEPMDDRLSPTQPAEIGDDNGGLMPHVEPGDDRGGANTVVEAGEDQDDATMEAEPGDDHGGTVVEPQPGDDHGGATAGGQVDDHSGSSSQSGSGDDHGGSSSNSGSGSDHGGLDGSGHK